MEEKVKNVLEFYVLCCRLKDVIRTGWKKWHVDRNRIESVAEHIFGTQMLAIAMFSEFEYDLDIKKVLYMLAVHELEEVFIGDFTPFQITREEKKKLGHEAVEKLLSRLSIKEDIRNIIFEFDERTSPEALFAYRCDKLECDIQCRLYDLEGCVDVRDPKNEASVHYDEIKKMLHDGYSWSELWMTSGQLHNNFDDNFMKVSKFAMNNDIIKSEEE